MHIGRAGLCSLLFACAIGRAQIVIPAAASMPLAGHHALYPVGVSILPNGSIDAHGNSISCIGRRQSIDFVDVPNTHAIDEQSTPDLTDEGGGNAPGAFAALISKPMAVPARPDCSAPRNALPHRDRMPRLHA